MEIRTKFKVGDVVYTINENYEAQTCKICEGKKTVRIKNMEFGCPHCNALGVTQDKIVWTVEDEIRISAIRTYNLEENVEIRYFDYKQDVVAYEENCFATKEEAEKECDKRNGKENNSRV